MSNTFSVNTKKQSLKLKETNAERKKTDKSAIRKKVIIEVQKDETIPRMSTLI